eukprot:1137150-Pelagomonas_calceolata.AAC.14
MVTGPTAGAFQRRGKTWQAALSSFRSQHTSFAPRRLQDLHISLTPALHPYLGPVPNWVQVHSAVDESHGQLSPPGLQAVGAQRDGSRHLRDSAYPRVAGVCEPRLTEACKSWHVSGNEHCKKSELAEAKNIGVGRG